MSEYFRWRRYQAKDGNPAGTYEPVDLDAIVAERCAPLVEFVEAIANDPKGNVFVLKARDALRAHREKAV